MRLILLLLPLLLAATFAAGQQRITVKPDGAFRFDTAIRGVTRISVIGDRIKSVLVDASQYEVINDADTGDLFMRYTGTGRARSESGFLVTETGVTVSYTATPKDATSAAVLITLNRPVSPDVTSAAPDIRFETGTASGSGSGSFEARTIAFLRQVIREHTDGRQVPSRRHGTLVRSVNGPGLRARVLVGRAGRTGGTIRPQDYYRPGVLAVYVERPVLGANGRTWIVILEARG